MPTTSLANKPTSLKLPAALKAQLENVAQNAGLSLHAFMLQTLAARVRQLNAISPSFDPSTLTKSST